MKKICSKCQLNKNYPEDFVKNYNYCKDCHNIKCRKWRELNREKYLESQNKYAKSKRPPKKEKVIKNREFFVSNAIFYIRRQRLKNVLWILNYFKTHFCVDCNNSDPLVLEFDHVRGIKKFNISEAMQRKISLDKLQSEIDKCDVRCANCHTIKTAKERKYTSYKILYEDFLNSPEGIELQK